MERVIADVNDGDFAIAADGALRDPRSRPRSRAATGCASSPTRPRSSRATTSSGADERAERPRRRGPAPHRPARWIPARPRRGPTRRWRRRPARRRRALRANTLGMPAPADAPTYPFVSRVPNVLPTPASFRASGAATLGAVDLYYAMAPYLLRPRRGARDGGPAARVPLRERRCSGTCTCRRSSTGIHRTSLNRAQMQARRRRLLPRRDRAPRSRRAELARHRRAQSRHDLLALRPARRASGGDRMQDDEARGPRAPVSQLRAARPFALRVLNKTGAVLRKLGVPLVRLDPDSLLQTARKSTGLSDFGHDRFREPLERLVASLEIGGEAHDPRPHASRAATCCGCSRPGCATSSCASSTARSSTSASKGRSSSSACRAPAPRSCTS